MTDTRKLQGKWTVLLVTETHHQHRFEHATEVAILPGGWCSFRDENGTLHQAAGSLLLRAENNSKAEGTK